jgi:GTPase SAR1 family protein/gas vesicle protein
MPFDEDDHRDESEPETSDSGRDEASEEEPASDGGDEGGESASRRRSYPGKGGRDRRDEGGESREDASGDDGEPKGRDTERRRGRREDAPDVPGDDEQSSEGSDDESSGAESDVPETDAKAGEESPTDRGHEAIIMPSPGSEGDDEAADSDGSRESPMRGDMGDGIEGVTLGDIASESAETPAGDLGERRDNRAESDRILPVSREYVEDLLGELGEIARSRGFDTISKEIYQDSLPDLREGRMSVVVLGEFNHGKSTVINALLGEQVLPVGITPTTSVITHLVYGDAPSAKVQPRDDGEAFEVGYDEMEDVIRESDEGEGGDPDYVEISYPNKLLRESLTLVDTPGVNDISQQKVEITYGYVPRSDVVLYVLDATQVLKKSEIRFIEERLLEANRDRIIFVLGKIDALSDEEAEEVEAYARERLASIMGEEVDLYAFSARDALEAQDAGEEPAVGFRSFRSELIAYLRDEKAEIIVDSALGSGLRVASMLEQNLAIERQAYRLERGELERRIKNVKQRLRKSRQLIQENLDLIDERIGGIKATAKHNLEVFTEDFKESLPRQIDAAEARDVQLYLSDWIQAQFKEWLETEGQEVAKSLEALAEEVIEITNESIQETVEAFRDEFGLVEQLDLDVDTIAYDMSVFALGSVGVSVLLLANTLVGGLLTAATPVLAMFLRGKVDEKIKERAREQGNKAIDEASEVIEQEMMQVIDDFGRQLEEFVETAGDRLYRQVDEALSQVRREMDEKDREESLEDVDEKLESVRRVARLLASAREELEDDGAEGGQSD